VSGDKSARDEIVAKYGRMATPLLAIGQKFFLGFRQNREEIEKIIDELAGRSSD
jgi:hypothetical protein